jgi:hypothetical protein
MAPACGEFKNWILIFANTRAGDRSGFFLMRNLHLRVIYRMVDLYTHWYK